MLQLYQIASSRWSVAALSFPMSKAKGLPRFLVNLVCARLAALKKRYPATRGAVDDLLTELIVVTIDDEE